MKTFKKFMLTLLLSIGSLFLLMQIALQQDISISDIELTVDNQTRNVARLPIKENIVGTYRVAMNVQLERWAPKTMRILPDDELLSIIVNGQSVPLNGYSKAELRDYARGIKIELPDLKHHEENRVEMILTNSSNPAGLDFRPESSVSYMTALLIFIALLILIYGVSRHLRLTKPQYGCLIAGLIVCLIYLSHTGPATRTFDVYEGGGHRDYIEYLITHKTTPPPGDGWEYHQPPLYYTLGALSKSLLIGPKVHNDTWGQLLAIWFWVIFLMACLATLKVSLPKRSMALFVASAAICLWPAGVIHSIRMGNDIPLYAFYSLSFYYAIRWWRSRNNSLLLYASIWASMALLTKSNALAAWGVLGMLFLAEAYRLWIHRKTRIDQIKKIRRAFVILATTFSLTVVLNLGDNVWHYIEGTSSDWLLSNVSDTIHPGLKVANNPVNYLVFDLATYLQNPFITSWDDKYGRQYFWNFVWRSSLTSEFIFEGKWFNTWGILNGIFLLMTLLGIILYAVQKGTLMNVRSRNVSLYRNLPWLSALIFPFLLLLAYRIKVPLSCNTDFRYIFPVLLPLLYFSSKVWSEPGLRLTKFFALGTPLIALLTLPWILVLASQ